MKLTFLGSGSAFTVNNYQSNMLLEDGDGILLIDCGSDIRRSLAKLNEAREVKLSYRDLKDVFISHLHDDHAGGLEWLGFNSYFDPKCSRPRLHVEENMAQDLWQNKLYGSMCRIGEKPDREMTLEDYFRVCPFKAYGKCMDWNGHELRVHRHIHVPNQMPDRRVISYGLMIPGQNPTYISTDTSQPNMALIAASSLVFQDCDTSSCGSPIHAHYSMLLEIPDQQRQKIWLYHYNDGRPLPDVTADGFAGFVKPGQTFEF